MKFNKKGILGIALVASALSMTSFMASCAQDTSKTIFFWHTFGHDIVKEVSRQAKEFEKLVKEHEGVDVHVELQYQGAYKDLGDKIEKGYAGGSTPSICVAYPDHVANYIELEDTKGDLVVNLDDYINDPEIGLTTEEWLNPTLKGLDDFVPSFIEEGRQFVNEGMYVFPYMKSTEVMTYNRDVVTLALHDMGIQEGVEKYMNDITWDELMALMNHINADRTKFGLDTDDSYVLIYDSDSNLFITQAYQRGIPYISLKDGKPGIDFNNPEAKKMVQEFKDMYDQKLLLTKGANNGKYGSDKFKNAKAIFTVGSSGGVGYSDPGASFNVSVCKFPVHKSATEQTAKYISQGPSLTLMRNRKLDKEVDDFKTKYAWKFIKYITSEENDINACFSSQGYIPVRQSCYTNDNYDYIFDGTDYSDKCATTVIKKINGSYLNYPVFKGSDKARTEVESIVSSVLVGKETIDDAFELAYENVMKQVGGSK